MRKYFLILSFVFFIGVSCNRSRNQGENGNICPNCNSSSLTKEQHAGMCDSVGCDSAEKANCMAMYDAVENKSNPEIAILQTAIQSGCLPPKGAEAIESKQPANPLVKTSEGRVAFKFINKNDRTIYFYADMTWVAPATDSKPMALGTWTMDVNNESSVNRTSETVVDRTQEVNQEEHQKKDDKNTNYLKTCASCGKDYRHLGFYYNDGYNKERIEELDPIFASIIGPCTDCSWIDSDKYKNYKLFCSRTCAQAFMDTK